jgi:hypothetical protein
MSMERNFTAAYAAVLGKPGAWVGSTPEYCRELIDFLAAYMIEKRVRSVCDLACGDLQWIPELVQRTGVSFAGVDCVAAIVSQNRTRYPQHSFLHADLVTLPPGALPEADLYIVKDVLQHWPSNTINAWLTAFFRGRPDARLVAINCWRQRGDDRTCYRAGDFAELDGAMEPLKWFSPVELFQWHSKKAYLLSPPSHHALVRALTVFAPERPKVRVGSAGDGGYVIVDGGSYDCFISGGIANDVSFEAQFLQMHPSLTCEAFDGSVEGLPWKLDRAVFHRKWISGREAAGETNLRDLLSRCRNAFVKIDVEGSEYAWLASLSGDDLGQISQLVIEFHDPFTEERWDTLARLAESHWLVHVHGNNFGGTKQIGDVTVPAVLECTYLRKEGRCLERSRVSVPGPEDQPNAAGRPDIVLRGEPYEAAGLSKPAQADGAGSCEDLGRYERRVHSRNGEDEDRDHFERSVQLLACDFSLVADCEELLLALDGVVPHASQRHPVAHYHRFEVSRRGNGYQLSEDGRELEPQPDASSAADFLLDRMHRIALAALPEFTKIHAACAAWRGKRLVAVGPAGSGKTTLMMRLLFEGFAVHCDDVVLLRQGEILPFPRRFRVRRNAVRLLPQVPAFAAEMQNGRDHLALDPSEIGFDWQIEVAPADAVFFLERNHGGTTKLKVCSKVAMAERIMSHSNPPASGPRAWLRDVSQLLECAQSFVLAAGELDAAAEAVKTVLSEANKSPEGGKTGWGTSSKRSCESSIPSAAFAPVQEELLDAE